MSTEPYSIVVSPGQIYLAPQGTAFPDVDEAPGAGWSLLGTSGNKNHSEAGITLTHEQTVDEHFVSGATGPQKATRQRERLLIAGELEDVTLEQYTKVMANVTPTVTAAGAGTPGYKTMNIQRGMSVAEFALLMRVASPYDTGMNMDYRIPRVYQSANPAPVYAKTGPAMLAFEFSALEDPDAASDVERFGKIVAQNAAAV